MERSFRYLQPGRALNIIFVIVVYSGLRLPTVSGADFTITCPTIGFIDSEHYILQCLVDMNTVGSGNCLVLNNVQFQYLQGSAVQGLLGSADYPTCNTAWISNTRCAGINATTNTSTYEVRYNADNTSNNGLSLRCWSDCFEKVPGTMKAEYGTCDPLAFIEPCVPNPCKNGGTCVTNATDPNGFNCHCPPNFSERTCDLSDNIKPVAPSYDFTLICPTDGYFCEGQTETLSCEVNGTALDAEMCTSLTSVIFELLDSENTSTLLASSRYPICNTTWSGDARCASKHPMTNIYVYEYQFKTDRATQHGKRLRCWSDCLPSVPSASVHLTTQACTIIIKADCRWFGFVVLIAFAPAPVPLPWPGYLIYVLICWCICKRDKSTGLWHPHYMCGKRTNNVYFSACFVTNDGRTVLIWSKSPATGRFVCYGTETTPGINSNNVSPESGAVKNGSKHTSQKETNKHTGTDGSPRKSRHPEAPVELTTVRTSSPPQAGTFHGDNQASGTPHGDDQASGTPRLRPLPEPSRMTSVERNSTAEYSNMPVRDKHPKLPPIGKPDNHP